MAGSPGCKAPAIDLIVALREASLLSVVDDGDDVRRWDVLESIREYALARLPDLCEGNAVFQRHAEFYLAEGERRAADLRTTRGLAARRALRVELHNFRVAFEWLLRETPRMGGLVARMAMVMHHAYRTWLPEMAVEAVSLALADVSARGASAEGSVRLFLARAAMRRETGDHHGAASDLFEAKSRIEELSDNLGTLVADSLLAEAGYEEGRLQFYRGRVKRARCVLENALSRATAAGDIHAEARIRSTLGIVLVEAFSLEDGFDHHQRSVALFDEMGDTIERSVARYWWTVDRLRFRQPCAAGELQAQASRMRDLGLTFHEAHSYIALCVHSIDVGALESAAEYAKKAERLGQRLGIGRIRACAAFGLGLVADERGDLAEASVQYHRAIAGHLAVGDLRLEIFARIHLAGVTARVGTLEHAEEQFAHAESLLAGCGDARMHELLQLMRSYLDLVLTRKSFELGRSTGVRSTLHTVRGRCDAARKPPPDERSLGKPLSECCFEARCALRILERELDVLGTARVDLQVAADGSGFCLSDGVVRNLPNGPVTRRALLVLAEQHCQQSGELLSTERLVRHCWGEERMAPRAARMRVRSVIRRLRRLGLETLIVTGPKGGYAIDSLVSVRIDEPELLGAPGGGGAS